MDKFPDLNEISLNAFNSHYLFLNLIYSFPLFSDTWWSNQLSNNLTQLLRQKVISKLINYQIKYSFPQYIGSLFLVES